MNMRGTPMFTCKSDAVCLAQGREGRRQLFSIFFSFCLFSS